MITAFRSLSHDPSGTGPEVAVQGVLESEFVFADSSRFRNVHASTLAETADGIVGAWRGAEQDDPVGIWVARKVGDEWTAPREVARCATPDDPGRPCLLPVLSAWPDHSIRLFYKGAGASCGGTVPTGDRWTTACRGVTNNSSPRVSLGR